MTSVRCLALAFLLAGIITSELSDRGSFKNWRVVNRPLMFSLAGKVSGQIKYLLIVIMSPYDSLFNSCP